MSDKKSLAIILGTAFGVAAATAIGFYIFRQEKPVVKDVNEIFESAKKTVKKLSDAVEELRKAEA